MTTPLAPITYCDSDGNPVTPDDLKHCNSDGDGVRGVLYMCNDAGEPLIAWPYAMPTVATLGSNLGSPPQSVVDLTWASILAKVVYEDFLVEKSDISSSGPWGEITESPVARGETGVTATTLASDTQYWFRVTARWNGTKVEDWLGTPSNVVTETTVIIVPSALAQFTGSYPLDKASDDDTILLQTASDEPVANSLDVYYRVGASMGGDPIGTGIQLSGDTIPIASIEESAVYEHATGEPHGTEIYYQARFRNAAGVGDWGTQKPVTVTMRVPGVPSILDWTFDYGPLQATVNWTATSPTTATTYQVNFDKAACGSGWEGSALFGNTSASPLVDSVIESHTYRFQVRAYNAAGWSNFSDWSNEIVTWQSPGIPTSRTAVYYAGSPTDTGTVTWSAATGTVDGYDVRWKAVLTEDDWDIDSDVTSSHSLTGLGDNTEYEAQIRAFANCFGTDGDWGAAAGTFYTAPDGPGEMAWTPTPPRGKSGTIDTIEYTPDGIDMDAYEVYYISGASGTPDEGDTLGGDTQTTGLNANSAYRFRFRGRQDAIDGSPHADSDWFWSPAATGYTHVDAPQITAWTQDTGFCPSSVVYDLTVSHIGAGGSARTGSWEYQTQLNSDGWSGWSSVSSLQTSVTGITFSGAGNDDWLYVRTRYVGHTPIDSASSQALCVA